MKNKINIIFTILFLVVIPNTIMAQQTPVFSSYNYNTVLINPAHAGYYEDTDIALTTNGYFNSVEGSPKNFDISVNTLTRSEKIGLATGIAHSQIGVTYATNFFASYSYKIFLIKIINTENGGLMIQILSLLVSQPEPKFMMKI